MKNIIKILSILLSILLIITILNLNIIPNKYLILIISVIILLNIISLIEKKQIISILLIILTIIGLKYTTKTINYFKNGFNNNLAEINKYNVIVLNSSNYGSLEDIDEVGYIKPNIYDLNKNMKEYDSIYVLYESLLKNNIQSIILEDTYIQLLKDNFEDIEENIKIIYSFDIKKEIEKQEETKELKPINIYISGSDSRSGKIDAKTRTDVNMIVTVNPNTNKILLTSIPRDYYVRLHNTTGYKDKLTHSGIYGIEMSKATIEDLFNIKIDYVVKVGFNSVVEIVDLIDGIEIDSDISFNCRCSDGIPSEQYINKGINKLDGKQALCYSRQRKVYQTGDNHRILNQQQVLEGIINKITKNKSLILKYSSLLDKISKLYKTDIPESLIKLYIKDQIENNTSWKIENQVVTGYGSTDVTYSMPGMSLYVMIPNEESIKEATKNIENLLN